MEHADHVRLLREGIPGPGGVWGDFGSGRGAFTLALAELVGPTSEIYSIDRDASALRYQERVLHDRFPRHPAANLHFLVADYTRRSDLPLLDGAVMANTLHFQRQVDGALQLIQSYLRPGGRLILVEYNTDHGNPWVPYPFSYETWEKIARHNGLVGTRRLATYPSRFMREIYSAASLKPT
jgi:ubiquinone/menaquinone biosynthesis C-methylase UbiE